MSRTKGPYTVWLVAPDDSISVRARSPRFSRSWRGGFKDGGIRLYEPLKSTNPLLAPMSKLRIDDARTGRTAWEGYVDLPGKTRGDEGDVWEIGAVGGKARLDDTQRQYIGIDHSFDGWKQTFATKTSRMSAGVGNLPAGAEEGADCLLLQWQNGIAVNDTDRLTMQYDRLRQSGQQVGGFQFTHREGFASTVQRTQILTRTAGGSEEIARSLAWVTSLTQSAAASAGGVSFPTGRNILKLRIYRDGGTAQNTDTENWWSGTTDMRVSALRRGADGEWIEGSGTYDNAFLLADEIITDTLFWFCGRNVGGVWFSSIDLLNADIDTSFTHEIDQFTYLDPTTFGNVLEDVALFEPDLSWEILESQPNGRHRFVVRRVLDGSTISGSDESGPRYIATSDDGWDAPGGEDDLFNAITVAWTDKDGKEESKQYSALDDFGIEVRELDQWGIVREGEAIELGDELGSEANADRIAEKYLEQAGRAKVSGTLNITRQKVHDAWNGRNVEAWEIEPGYPMLVRDLDITLPITEVEVEDNVSSLTLSEPVLDDEQLVNMYARRRRVRA